MRRIENELKFDAADWSFLQDVADSGAMVCLVDDIMTTGETMRQCVRALRAVEVDVGVGLALARTPSSLERHTCGKGSPS